MKLKGIPIGKEEVKLSLFADEVILLIYIYIRYIYTKLRRLHQKLRTNKFSKVAGYKINI